MMEKLKKNMKPTLVLGIICIIVAALLAAVNLLTEPEIERRRLEEITKSLTDVMPNGKFGTEPDALREDAPETVKAVYTDQNGGGYVFVLETKTDYTSGENMGITVAISTDGKIIDVKLTSYTESKDFGKEKYPDSYVGLDADGVASAPLVSGVTYSSSAFKSAIYDALKYIGVASGDVSAPDTTPKPELTSPRSDDEIKALALDLVKNAGTLTDITPAYNKPYNLMRLYKAEGNVGFIAYVVNPGEYVPVASEAIFHLDADGDIVDFKLLNWVVGYDKEKYDAPPSYSDELIDTYVGKDNWNIGDATLVSGATGTSSALRDSVAEVLRYIVINCAERSEEKVLDLASRFVPFASGFEAVSIDGMPETLKHLYKTDGVKSGYVAHVVVAGAYVPIATEALIYFDKDGVIADIELLIWNVGHGVEPGDFAEGFIGKSAEDIEQVALVSAATGTSSDFKAEVAKIIPLIPIASDFPIVFGAVAAVLVLAGFITLLIYFKRRNRAK